ncbi:Flp family type IVb pilin [Cognatishimia sp.]|uniref:Flp family type IVb pilin n=1 Tax=Cognatishimia sp. TaxID=2211648 RepID=UPI00351914D6
MAKYFEHFIRDERGAISVEWVVLTAALVGLAVSAGTIVETETHQLAADIGATVQAWDVTTPAASTSD